MRSLVIAAIILSSMVFAQAPPTFISLVKKAALDGDFATAQKELDQYKAVKGQTPEYLEAWSWIGRGQLAQKHYDAATASAEAVRKVALAQLAHRKVDDDPNFPIALGATIEVEAQAAAAQ